MKVLACVLTAASLLAQSQTYTVRVNPDGTFSPKTVFIRSGDTVHWEGLTRSDSVVSVSSGAYPAMCAARNPWDASDFTGPVPFAPSGIFTLSPLDDGLVEQSTPCTGRSRQVATAGGKFLCTGGSYQASLEPAWRDEALAGVFIRLLWKDVNPRAGVYDFSVLQREVDQAIRSGKVYSLGIKAGSDGTPDWIFSTNPDDSPRAGGGGGVPRLHLQDSGDGELTGCGVRMDLGNPTRARYKELYFAMLTETARFLKTRADWYRALAYVKISGANLFSHENRLPNGCETSGTTRCVCNTQILAADGYRPSLLYQFYDEQNQLLRQLFPGKPMSYALIQAGFPRINESGGYLNFDGASSDRNPLPGGTEQTESILDRGQQSTGRSYVVQHNGLGLARTPCTFAGVNPKPLRPLNGYSDPPCPNRWVIREGAEGQITGYQTRNPSDVLTNADLDSTFQNMWDNSDGMFLEIYEQVYWLAVNTNRGVLPTTGRTLAAWANEFHRRRVDPVFPNFTAAGNPYPSTYSRTFTRTSPAGTSQTLSYIHGMKCGQGRGEWGQIVIDAQPPSVTSAASAGAFGASPAIAPGTWIEVFGANLGGAARQWAGSDFNGLNAPTTLDGTTVRIGGQAAHIAYVSDSQVNAQVPSGVAAGPQPLTVTTATGSSAARTLAVNAAEPGLLAPPSFLIGGRQYVVALFPDGVFVLPPNAISGVASRRARPGETITLYGIGFGAVTPTIPAGQIVQAANTLAAPFRLLFGAAQAQTPFAGLAPNAVGLYQFNAVVPNVAAGDAVPVTFTLGGTPGRQTTLVTAIAAP